MKRSYKQNCALAHGLDIIGERWTLLIVRELLIGARRYGELLNNLSGVGTNLLASRLREMETHELVEKRDNLYMLTETGRRLEPVVWSVVRFGLSLDKADRKEWLTRPEWDAVALRAVYDRHKGSAMNGRYVLELDGTPFAVDRYGQDVSIRHGDSEKPIARVRLGKPAARRLAAGRYSLSAAIDRGDVKIEGGLREAKRLLAAFGIL